MSLARAQVSLADTAFPFSVARRAARPPQFAALWRRLLDERLGGALTPADVDALWTAYASAASAAPARRRTMDDRSGEVGVEAEAEQERRGNNEGGGRERKDGQSGDAVHAESVLTHAGAFDSLRFCMPSERVRGTFSVHVLFSSAMLKTRTLFLPRPHPHPHYAPFQTQLTTILHHHHHHHHHPSALAPDVCALLEDAFLASLARLGPAAVGDAARTYLLRRVPALALRVMAALAGAGGRGNGDGSGSATGSTTGSTTGSITGNITGSSSVSGGVQESTGTNSSPGMTAAELPTV